MSQLFIGILQRSCGLLLDFLPYVLVGVFLAEILKYTSWADFVQKSIRKSPMLSVVMAAVLGIVSPLCTYGTVPLIIRLYTRGTPLAPLMTFLGASSLINPQLFWVTCGGFGLVFALIRLGSVFVFSVLLGVIFTLIGKKIPCVTSGEIHEKIKPHAGRHKDFKHFHVREFLKDAWSTFKFIGYYLVLGVFISVALEVVAPVSLLFEKTTMEWLNIIVAAFVSIPVYVCGGGVIPLVKMLMDHGMSTGASMAFLIVGPATRVTALVALGSFLSKKMIGLYVAFLIVFSVILGLVLNMFFV